MSAVPIVGRSPHAPGKTVVFETKSAAMPINIIPDPAAMFATRVVLAVVPWTARVAPRSSSQLLLKGD